MNASNPFDNTSARYSHVAIFLHWLIALGIFCAIPLGLYMADLQLSPTKLQLFAYHKWLGIGILTLVVVRLLWRITHRPPALPASMSSGQQRLAHGIAHGMYLLMFLVPLTGWLMSSAFGKPVVLFGMPQLQLPDLIGPNEQVGKFFKEAHEVCNYIFCTLISLHILASLKHHFMEHDGILARMLPFLEKKSS
jgi:cytochrome b561